MSKQQQNQIPESGKISIQSCYNILLEIISLQQQQKHEKCKEKGSVIRQQGKQNK